MHTSHVFPTEPANISLPLSSAGWTQIQFDHTDRPDNTSGVLISGTSRERITYSSDLTYKTVDTSSIIAPVVHSEGVTSNVTPSAITLNWYALRKLPENLFACVYESASAAELKIASGHPGMRPGALKDFISVWEGVSDIADLPTVSVTPKGYIVSEWYLDPDNSLVLMFDGLGKLYYSLFDKGNPCEGYEEANEEFEYPNLLRMLRSRTQNPFSWSDFSE